MFAFQLQEGKHGYHHDVRTDDEVAPGNPKSFKGNEYSLGDEVIAYKSPKSGFYEINPIYDQAGGGTIRSEQSYRSADTEKINGGSETEISLHVSTNEDGTPSTSPPVSFQL